MSHGRSFLPKPPALRTFGPTSTITPSRNTLWPFGVTFLFHFFPFAGGWHCPLCLPELFFFLSIAPQLPDVSIAGRVRTQMSGFVFRAFVPLPFSKLCVRDFLRVFSGRPVWLRSSPAVPFRSSASFLPPLDIYFNKVGSPFPISDGCPVPGSQLRPEVFGLLSF